MKKLFLLLCSFAAVGLQAGGMPDVYNADYYFQPQLGDQFTITVDHTHVKMLSKSDVVEPNMAEADARALCAQFGAGLVSIDSANKVTAKPLQKLKVARWTSNPNDSTINWVIQPVADKFYAITQEPLKPGIDKKNEGLINILASQACGTLNAKLYTDEKIKPFFSGGYPGHLVFTCEKK